MVLTQYKQLNIIFTLLFIISFVACTAEATEQDSESTHENKLDDHNDHSVANYSSNVPETELLSHSSVSQQSSKHTRFTCILNSPYEVRHYELKCEQAEYLDIKVADCCIEGDVWQAKAKVWDKSPNSVVTVNPKSITETSIAARVYNYSGTVSNPKKLTALVQCSYKNGVNNFPAAALFTTESDGYCTMKDLGVSIKMH